MLNSLVSLVADADAAHRLVIENSAFLAVADIDTKVRAVYESLAAIRAAEAHITTVYNSIKRVLYDRRHCCRDTADNAQCVVAGAADMKEVVPDVPVPVKIVDTMHDVPNAPIYWVRDTGAFAIKLNGIELSGHVGRIFTKHTPKDEVRRVRVCPYGARCNVRFCRHSHPLGGDRDHIRNFLASSWLYTSQPRSHKNLLMRHIGDGATLATDLKIGVCADECELRKAQLLHDILVTVAMQGAAKKR